MERVVAHCVALLLSLFVLAESAWAVVVRQPVTPASVKEKGSKFIVNAEKRADGLIHFEITYSLQEPEYVGGHFELRGGEATLVKTDTSAFVHEATATYYIAVSPKHLADSTFELSSNGFTESGGQPVAMPGGAIYQIDLAAFGKNAPAAKTD